MSRIEQLIKEKCPNGVAFYRLSEIGAHYTGLSGKSKKNFENGNCKYITYSNIFNNPSTRLDVEDYVQIDANEKQNSINFKDILVAGSSENLEDSGMISIVTTEPKERIYLNSFCFGFRLNNIFYEKFNADFLKHLFRNNNFRNEIVACSFGVTRYNLSKEKFLKIKIPCPPLEIQEEIVRILDKFGELEMELEVELEARKSQYEFWRKKVFELNAPVKKLRDISRVIDSLHATPKYVSNGYPMIRVADVKFGYVDVSKTLKVDKDDYYKFISKYKPVKDDIIISRVGSFGNVCLVGNEDVCLGQNTSIIHPSINPKYLYYYLSSDNVQCWIKDNVNGAGYKSLSLANINEIPIKVPTMLEQERIVNILEKFDEIINDLSNGLPAEIELRRQQYEYYRNKLLSFEEL